MAWFGHASYDLLAKGAKGRKLAKTIIKIWLVRLLLIALASYFCPGNMSYDLLAKGAKGRKLAKTKLKYCTCLFLKSLGVLASLAFLARRSYDASPKQGNLPEPFLKKPWRSCVLGALGEKIVYACLNRKNSHGTQG